MPIDRTPTYNCGTCGARKGAANRWLVGWVPAIQRGREKVPLGYALADWDETLVTKDGVEVFCSEHCALIELGKHLRLDTKLELVSPDEDDEIDQKIIAAVSNVKSFVTDRRNDWPPFCVTLNGPIQFKEGNRQWCTCGERVSDHEAMQYVAANSVPATQQ